MTTYSSSRSFFSKRRYSIKSLILKSAVISYCVGGVCLAQADPYPEFLYHDSFDGDGLARNNVKGGGLINASPNGAQWSDEGNGIYNNNATGAGRRAIIYSENSFQSDTGFLLHVSYKTGSIDISGGHNLSFGLVRADRNLNLASYRGTNPFASSSNLYSVGANLTTQGGNNRGLNFLNGATVTELDTSGTRQQFGTDEFTKVTIEIGEGGYWCYRINGEYEASGALPENFDLEANYHIVVYGQDDNGGGKEIDSITLEKRYALGERAAGLRGNWNAGQGDAVGMHNAGIRTVDSTIARLNEGASGSAQHNAPSRLLESISLGESSVGGGVIRAAAPISWGDLSDDEPDEDRFMDEIQMIRNLQFGVKIYSNSETFTGVNGGTLQEIAERWFEWCDTNPEAQAFINSQPYHTGIWNSETQQYVDATETFPMRKYMFCYAEFILKEYSLRYGKYASSWIFDSAKEMGQNGDNGGSGNFEDQRIFQAFANAVHAGNPEIPIAYNRGRLNNSLINDPSFPFARSTRFCDFTFGHAFNGNSSHASDNRNPARRESIFDSNYRHVSTMTASNGFVQTGGEVDWDDKVVGNYHSKLGPASWQHSSPSAWTQDEFNQWNLEAMQAGGHMTWEGSVPRGRNVLRDWAIELIKNTDDYLAENESPNTPNWSRKYTDLPEATGGEAYFHELEEGVDFWDPEGDRIVNLRGVTHDFFSKVPTWLRIEESSAGTWILSGTPPVNAEDDYEFTLEVIDSNGFSGSRQVEFSVKPGVGNNNGAGNSVLLTKRNATGFSLDGGVGGADGQNVHLWSTNSNNVNQQWDEINRGGGYFSYQKRNTNFSIDGGRGGEREQNVYIWSTSANNFNQHWRKVRITANAYRLEKRNAIGYSIDGGVGGARGQNVYLWSSGNTNQNMQWIIE